MNGKSGSIGGRHESIWAATATMPDYPPLTQDIRVDVCIVGGGIAGLSTAYMLSQEGRSVAVLDAGTLAGGMTQVTTAHLMSAIDDRYFEIERMHGQKGSQLAAESHAEAINRVERIVNSEGIACDFERLDGYLFLGPEHDEQLLERELAAAQRAGLQ
ncbi:MAG: NAD(P)/FAD-dependent oxidoreductase, partial [Planctomycetaceae bacterium]